jgi:hypothetical protein
MSELVWNPELARLVRAGTWDDLAEGTWPRLLRAISEGRRDDAAHLADFFVVEARVCFDIYTQWNRDTLRFLEHRGLDAAAIDAELLRVETAILAFRPEGTGERDEAFARIAELAAAVSSGTDADASTRFAWNMRDLWRHLHDTDVDRLTGLFDVVVRRFGEDAIGDMYENWLIGDWFNTRYVRFDVSRQPWEQAFDLLVYLTFESMHGHLAGAGREGSITFESFEDRVVFSFDPCGSGGRTVRGEPLDPSPPRDTAPFEFAVLKEAHAFTGGKKGVCTYCAHCCILTEKLPIERFGYPVRVVDPPLWPEGRNDPCRWTIYRRPEDVPEEIYARVGSRKPAAGEVLGSAGRIGGTR